MEKNHCGNRSIVSYALARSCQPSSNLRPCATAVSRKSLRYSETVRVASSRAPRALECPTRDALRSSPSSHTGRCDCCYPRTATLEKSDNAKELQKAKGHY